MATMPRSRQYSVAGRMRPCQSARIGCPPGPHQRIEMLGAVDLPGERPAEKRDQRVGSRGDGRGFRAGAEGSSPTSTSRRYCGPPPPSGRHPVDHLVGIHDVAGLAVHAVRGVDLQLLGAVAGVDHLVDVGRAEARARVAVLLAAAGPADVGVVDDQVRGLILGVARARVVDVGQPVERQLAIDAARGSPSNRGRAGRRGSSRRSSASARSRRATACGP